MVPNATFCAGADPNKEPCTGDGPNSVGAMGLVLKCAPWVATTGALLKALFWGPRDAVVFVAKRLP